MAERESDEPVETSWEQVSPKQYRAELVSEKMGRRLVHEYLICEYVVVEVDKLFEEGEPLAVFRTPMSADELGEFGDEDELVRVLKELAFDAPGFQLIEEFDASVQTFESGG